MNSVPYLKNIKYINNFDKSTGKQFPEEVLFKIYKELFTQQENNQILHHANNQGKGMDEFLNEFFRRRNQIGGRKKTKRNKTKRNKTKKNKSKKYYKK